jgi:Kef-type K+ transport system membrane component KefB
MVARGCLFAYLIGMLGILLPFSNRYAERIRRQRSAVLSHETLVVIVLCVLTSAAATEAMGVHPLFGAFIAGICFPRIPKWQNTVRARFQTAVTVLLLPFFFVLTGMRTRLDLLSYGTIWLWTGLIVAVAVAGKMGGAVLASRWSGESWQDAFTLGALLNTRGLVELIVLNIAYDAHVFSATLFTMLIAMALITTMMTAPLLNLLGVHKSARRGGISPSLGPV